jgi:hypothetical protein
MPLPYVSVSFEALLPFALYPSLLRVVILKWKWGVTEGELQAAYGNEVIVCGGITRNTTHTALVYLDSCERFDENLNPVPMPSMPYVRSFSELPARANSVEFSSLTALIAAAGRRGEWPRPQ